jgi:membrane protease YdiL (CAAX protease family)
MTAAPLLVLVFLLSSSVAAPWLVRRSLRSAERPDGSPSASLLRASESLNIAFALALLALGLGGQGRLVSLAHLWRHDLWSALLIGALAGLFLHFVGGGSPLPVASLHSARRRTDADTLGVLLFAFGEAGAVIIWFGAGLPSLLHLLPRLLSLPVVAGGYGLARAAAGQDHPLLGAIDGLLLGLLYLLSGSLLAVLLAHFVVDLLAYVSAATHAEDAEMASEAGEPLSARSADDANDFSPGRLVELDRSAEAR